MLPKEYRKLVIARSSSNFREAVDVQTVSLDVPAAGEVVVRTAYAGVNAADYLQAVGRYLAKTEIPSDLGSEAIGEVVAVGEGVNHLQQGNAVFAIGAGYSDYFTIPARYGVRLPSLLPEAVSLGVSGLTAALALEHAGEMTSGETVFVTAAAGGTGNIVVQLAKQAGNTVIGTCGSDDKVEFLRQIGCDRPINYRSENVRQVLKDEFPRGIDIAFESVGGELYDTALRSLAVKGRLIVIGAISEYESGPQAFEHIRESYYVLNKSASIRGFWLMHYLRDSTSAMERLLSLLVSDDLKLGHRPHTVRRAKRRARRHRVYLQRSEYRQSRRRLHAGVIWRTHPPRQVSPDTTSVSGSSTGTAFTGTASRTIAWLLPVGLMLLFVALRWHDLLRFPIFLDEADHIDWASDVYQAHPFTGAINGKLFGLWWMALFDLSATQATMWLVRAVTVLFQLLSVATLYALGRRFAGLWGGGLAVALMLLAPYSFFYDRNGAGRPVCAALRAAERVGCAARARPRAMALRRAERAGCMWRHAGQGNRHRVGGRAAAGVSAGCAATA